MNGKLAGKVALVTGASSGIGEAAAEALAREGAKVGLAARRRDRLEQLAARIPGGLESALPVVADVSDPEQARQAVLKTKDKFGRLDILVNNAGIMLLGPVAGADITDWQRMFDINVLGLMYCTHTALPIMKAQGSGHIINISSVSGRVVSARSAAYSATKFAVNAFSEGLRQEVHKDGIRVTAIEPGAVSTELTDHITNDTARESIKSWVASMHALESKDIAQAIVYVASQPAHVNINEILLRPTEQAH